MRAGLIFLNSLCNFQSMKKTAELNGFLQKFFMSTGFMR